MSSLQYPADAEERLVQLARVGDENAMATLISGMVPFVKARASAFAGKHMEAEDLAQEGMLGFLSAVYSFRPDKDASFRTYASVCINNRIISAVRSQLSRKHRPLNQSVSLDGENIPVEDTDADPQNILSAQEETARLLGILNEQLSGFEKNVMIDYLSGLSYEQTAKKLGKTTKAVDNALQRAKKKLKASAD